MPNKRNPPSLNIIEDTKHGRRFYFTWRNKDDIKHSLCFIWNKDRSKEEAYAAAEAKRKEILVQWHYDYNDKKCIETQTEPVICTPCSIQEVGTLDTALLNTSQK